MMIKSVVHGKLFENWPPDANFRIDRVGSRRGVGLRNQGIVRQGGGLDDRIIGFRNDEEFGGRLYTLDCP